MGVIAALIPAPSLSASPRNQTMPSEAEASTNPRPMRSCATTSHYDEREPTGLDALDRIGAQRGASSASARWSLRRIGNT